jgi:hypothetical protein
MPRKAFAADKVGGGGPDGRPTSHGATHLVHALRQQRTAQNRTRSTSQCVPARVFSLFVTGGPPQLQSCHIIRESDITSHRFVAMKPTGLLHLKGSARVIPAEASQADVRDTQRFSIWEGTTSLVGSEDGRSLARWPHFRPLQWPQRPSLHQDLCSQRAASCTQSRPNLRN